MYNKEDMGLSSDVESKDLDNILELTGIELDEAMDDPLTRFKMLFPYVKNPLRSLVEIKLRIISCYIDIPKQYSFDQVQAEYLKKTQKSKLEFDIIVNTILDTEYRLIVELEAESQWMDIVKKRSHFLEEETQLRNNLYVEPDYTLEQSEEYNQLFDVE